MNNLIIKDLLVLSDNDNEEKQFGINGNVEMMSTGNQNNDSNNNSLNRISLKIKPGKKADREDDNYGLKQDRGNPFSKTRPIVVKMTENNQNPSDRKEKLEEVRRKMASGYYNRPEHFAELAEAILQKLDIFK